MGNRSSPQIRFKVAVASGKGGVGKSTVTANLAVALARLGYKVGLMDLDIYGPSQQMMMGIDEKPFVSTEDSLLQPQVRHGVRVATLGALMDVDQPAVWRGPMVMKAVEQLLTGVRWGLLDFLIADLPPLDSGVASARVADELSIDLLVRLREGRFARRPVVGHCVHSPRYLGSIARHVTQS